MTTLGSKLDFAPRVFQTAGIAKNWAVLGTLPPPRGACGMAMGTLLPALLRWLAEAGWKRLRKCARESDTYTSVWAGTRDVSRQSIL